jgi:hypothetical protein
MSPEVEDGPALITELAKWITPRVVKKKPFR